MWEWAEGSLGGDAGGAGSDVDEIIWVKVITGGFYFIFFKIQMIKQKMTTSPVSFNLHLISLEKKTSFQFILSIVTLQKHFCSAKSIWTLVLTSSVNMRRWNFLLAESDVQPQYVHNVALKPPPDISPSIPKHKGIWVSFNTI